MTDFAAGHCACGQAKFALQRPPLFVHCCHCRHCQRETGSGFVLNVLIETAEVRYTDAEVVSVDIPTASGQGQVLRQCRVCSTTLWSHYAGAGDKVAFVRAGTLDNPAIVKPDIHIFTESALPWLPPADGVPRKPRYYNPQKYWPAASLARRAALDD